MALMLHQFPISHYCEKVRWALDHKKLPYRLKNELPGPHLKRMKNIAPMSSVPVLRDGKTVVQGSANIISYLDETFAQYSLTPASPAEREQAAQWEAFCDEEIGPHVRRFCYHTLLEHPNIVQPFFTQGAPFWGKWLVKAAYPKLQQVMRKAMAIREPEVTQSRQCLESALQRLYQEYQQRPYLVGDQFSRADLAAASLLAPLFMPEQYGLAWPDTMPEPLQGWVTSQAQLLIPIERLYEQHR